MTSAVALAALGAVLLAPLAASAQSVDVQPKYRQSAAVLAHYGDVAIPLNSPALAAGRTGFTSQTEMTAYLEAIALLSSRVSLGSLGRSAQGRDLPYLLFTAEGLSDPKQVRALDRPVVWLMGGQHGNEPAGGEAMLALSAALANGELSPLLDKVSVVIVPRANPDGAAVHRRRTSADLDLNRDHLLATLPETRALQAMMADLPPDLVIDAHEYAAAGPWLSTFGALAPWDAMFLEATHPGVPSAVTGLAERVFRPAMEARLAQHGLSSHTFLAGPGAEADDGVVPTGGAAPGISRNYFGLAGAVSLLVETRGGDAGRDGLQRRVATHYLAAAAALEAAAKQGPQLRRTVEQARRRLAADRGDLAVGYAIGTRPATLVFMDSVTAEEKPVNVDLRDSREVRVTATRLRPQGYILTAEAAAAIEALRIKGVRTCAAPAGPMRLEAYQVIAEPLLGRSAREGINPDAAVTVRTATREVRLRRGAVYVPIDQAQSAILAASLEPDSPGSYVGVGLARVSADGEAPIYRVPMGAKIADCSA